MIGTSPDFIDWSDPVDWSHPLNRGLVEWWLAVPGTRGFGSSRWRGLCDRQAGTLTSMDPATDWLGEARQGGFGAVDHDGSDDRIDLGPSRINGLVSLTVQMKINVRAFGSPATCRTLAHLGAWGSAAIATDMFTINVNSGNFSAEFSPDGTNTSCTGSITVTTGEWYDVCFTRNAADAFMYVDGVLKGSNTSCPTGGMVASGGVLSNNDEINSHAFNGKMDSIRILNRALSAAEVLEYYQRSRIGYPGLLNPISRFNTQAYELVAPSFNAAWATRSNTIMTPGVG